MKRWYNPSFLEKILDKSLYPITNTRINQIMTNDKKFIGCYPHDMLPRLNNYEKCIINLADSDKPGTHWIALLRINKNIYHFDSFGVEYISQKIKNFYSDYIIISNIYRIQKLNSVLCGSYCLLFCKYPINNPNDFIDFLSMFKPI